MQSWEIEGFEAVDLDTWLLLADNPRPARIGGMYASTLPITRSLGTGFPLRGAELLLKAKCRVLCRESRVLGSFSGMFGSESFLRHVGA